MLWSKKLAWFLCRYPFSCLHWLAVILLFRSIVLFHQALFNAFKNSFGFVYYVTSWYLCLFLHAIIMRHRSCMGHPFLLGAFSMVEISVNQIWHHKKIYFSIGILAICYVILFISIQIQSLWLTTTFETGSRTLNLNSKNSIVVPNSKKYFFWTWKMISNKNRSSLQP